MQESFLIVESRGQVATLLLNRPKQRNALNPLLLAELRDELEQLKDLGEARVVIIGGAGEKAFSAGYDITSIPTGPPRKSTGTSRLSNPVEDCMAAVARFPYPTIAMIGGSAFGAGLELAVCCDLRVACEDARMGMPPAKLGLVYMADGLNRFINVVGLANAKEIFLTGRTYDARRARELGLVHYVVERSKLESFTRGLAEEIAGNAPLALVGLKEVMNRVSARELADEDRRVCEELVARCFASRDFEEARQAFIEKRQPRFKGR